MSRRNHHARDCAWIVKRAQASADAFASVAVFVLLTIRQGFFLMPQQTADVREHGAESRFLFGAKRQGFAYILANKESLWTVARDAKAGKISHAEAIARFLSIPGLGIVKASFLAQMTTGDGACLDMHNLRALGLAEAAFKTPKSLKPETLMAKISAYDTIWRKEGDSAEWWNRWCDHVAKLYPKRFANGAEVSALHKLAVECL